jgi:hypothetical protein
LDTDHSEDEPPVFYELPTASHEDRFTEFERILLRLLPQPPSRDNDVSSSLSSVPASAALASSAFASS